MATSDDHESDHWTDWYLNPPDDARELINVVTRITWPSEFHKHYLPIAQRYSAKNIAQLLVLMLQNESSIRYPTVFRLYFSIGASFSDALLKAELREILEHDDPNMSFRSLLYGESDFAKDLRKFMFDSNHDDSDSDRDSDDSDDSDSDDSDHESMYKMYMLAMMTMMMENHSDDDNSDDDDSDDDD